MFPEEEAPVALPDETLPDATAESTATPPEQPQEPAAAAQEDTEVKKLRDRLAEQGRKNRAAEQLALQQAQQIQNLTAQLSTVMPFLNQLQVDQERARLQQMTPEEQPAQIPPQQPAQPSDAESRMVRYVDDINTELGLEDDPLTPEEVGYHADETSWKKAARLIAMAKAKERTTEVPANKPANSKPLTEEQIIEKAAQKIRQEMGIGRPNAANPSGSAASGMTIEQLNKMAAQHGKSPRAIAEEMRKLPA
jgi:hypothetical protein